MNKIIRSDQRAFNDIGWLQTYWLFSFAEYYDPENVRHGKLRVFNDDYIKPKTGFPMHPHEEMEIISILLDGEMVHEDTMGNKTIIQKNDVQRMTAGTGLYHSEKNQSDAPVHFYQIWIKPDTKGLVPSYDQKNFDPALWQNRLGLLASDNPGKTSVSLNTRAAVYRCRIDGDRPVRHTPKPGWKTFIYLIKGEMEINGIKAEKNDQARIGDETDLFMKTATSSDFILIDVPGRDQT
jgi:redox-sensitive bicupin YhaK (pirin superfamily)